MVAELPVLEMFNELIRLGYIHPTEMVDMPDIGAYQSVPTITAYGTPDMPVCIGVHTHAELEQRSKGDIINPNDAK